MLGDKSLLSGLLLLFYGGDNMLLLREYWKYCLSGLLLLDKMLLKDLGGIISSIISSSNFWLFLLLPVSYFIISSSKSNFWLFFCDLVAELTDLLGASDSIGMYILGLGGPVISRIFYSSYVYKFFLLSFYLFFWEIS